MTDNVMLFEMYNPTIVDDTSSLNSLAVTIHVLNATWWEWKWDDEQNKEVPDRNKGESIALMHSELSEALEGVRKGKQDEHIPDLSSEVVEMADTIIRILDYCAGFKLPIGEAVYRKLRYNASRSDHRPENREKAGGKKF